MCILQNSDTKTNGDDQTWYPGRPTKWIEVNVLVTTEPNTYSYIYIIILIPVYIYIYVRHYLSCSVIPQLTTAKYRTTNPSKSGVTNSAHSQPSKRDANTGWEIVSQTSWPFRCKLGCQGFAEFHCMMQHVPVSFVHFLQGQNSNTWFLLLSYRKFRNYTARGLIS